MKIKNVMFSGFAAAIFATVCGAASAADVSLISKEYADAKLQAKLTQGQGIAIVNQEDGTAEISANVDLSTLATKDSVTALEEKFEKDAEGNIISVTQQISDKIGNLGDGIDTVEEALGKKQASLTAEQQAAVDSGITAGAVAKIGTNEAAIAKNAEDIAQNAEDIALKANTADVYSKTDADAKFMIMQDADALGANLQWTNEGKLDTKGIATADGLQALEGRVNGSAETQGTVAYDIAAALKSANDYTDALAEGQVATNTAAIATNTENIGKNTAAIATKAETSALQEVREIAEAAQTETEVASAIDAKITGLNLGETYQGKLNEAQIAAVNSGIDVDKVTAYQAVTDAVNNADSGLAKTYEIASGAASAASSNADNIAKNAGDIATKVPGIKTAGTYLVNFDDAGAVSYAPIQILDAQGAPITLSGDNAVKPSAGVEG